MENCSPTRASSNGVGKLPPSPTRENGVTNRSPTRDPGNGRRKLSPSPTRSSDPEQRKPSASPPPPRVPKWLILDRIVHRSSRRHCGVVKDDATASALAQDCAARPVRASLRIADPPAVSRLYLHLTGRPAISFQEPTAIAAHRNSILFRLTAPFEDPMWWHDRFSFPIDYFVYSCRSSSPPSLTLLPPCFDGGHINPQLDKLCTPYRRQRQRTMLPEDMGILCHGDQGEFTVAELLFSKPYEIELCLLHNPPPAGSSMEWKVKKVQIPPDTKISTYSWMTDAVFPIGTCLCWVDNYQGMLAIDVLTDSNSNPDHQQCLRCIPLPKKALKSQRLYKDAGEPDPLRSVCVTDTGIIKLVCILTECPTFTIKAWTLDDIHEGRWTMDLSNTMGAEEFFRLLGTGHSCLPQVQPSFPLVSLVDPDVICFLLKDKDRGLFWMIYVNMKYKKLLSSALYISEQEEEDGYPPKRGRRNNFFGHCFIRSKFSSYLSENAITSRDLSEKMQKTKEARVTQKS
ncbi:uncharacterized protein LOC8076349 [Sorghum bicolor]|nr:uncharacterized protein LOC8076349 [Sorghum bicolor]|eukprot:XP_002450039.2 uncharacterized protein LOC8076349 [Sorghum bicolor]